jgi:hypothetical protein
MTGGFSVVSLDCQRVDFRCESAFQAHASQAWMTLCVSWCRISFGDCDKGLLQCGTCARLVSGNVSWHTGPVLYCFIAYIYICYIVLHCIAHYSCIGWTIFFPEINIARTNKNQQLVHLCDYNVMPCSTSLSTSLERLAFGRPCATETSAFSGDQCNAHWEN